jgi:hypothetical protein
LTPNEGSKEIPGNTNNLTINFIKWILQIMRSNKTLDFRKVQNGRKNCCRVPMDWTSELMLRRFIHDDSTNKKSAAWMLQIFHQDWMNWERICNISAADSLKNDSYLGIFVQQ